MPTQPLPGSRRYIRSSDQEEKQRTAKGLRHGGQLSPGGQSRTSLLMGTPPITGGKGAKCSYRAGPWASGTHVGWRCQER
uniref:Apolipoprotein B mRNA editing enzyme catalytic subunit 3A n=1 Tax=Rousettus aegyptiacus TaxID=9407 RepID=A0A7J8J9K0_ROUAE|nr:apolipoprotein B mRNA editing enzyme catalytic subunit 3A [Rousettus aegyptiacus]